VNEINFRGICAFDFIALKKTPSEIDTLIELHCQKHIPFQTVQKIADGYRKLKISRRIINDPSLGILEDEQATFNFQLNSFEAMLGNIVGAFLKTESFEKYANGSLKDLVNIICRDQSWEFKTIWNEMIELERIYHATHMYDLGNIAKSICKPKIRWKYLSYGGVKNKQ
jgi:hypothetical protein